MLRQPLGIFLIALMFMACAATAGGAQTLRRSTVWDLKIKLGQWNLQKGEVVIGTAVTMPWLQVKLLAHFLRLQIAWHELQNGKVTLMGTIPE